MTDTYSAHPAHPAQLIRRRMLSEQRRGGFLTAKELSEATPGSTDARVRTLLNKMEVDGQVEKYGVAMNGGRTWRLLGPVQAAYPGSSKARQEIGDPGHCEECVGLGHVLAHPRLGCADVGCTAAHASQEPVETPVSMWASEYLVTAVPDSHASHRSTLTLQVKWRGKNPVTQRDGWSVSRFSEVWNETTRDWEYELSPSNRSDEFVAQTRYPLDQAQAIARRLAPLLTTNGWTVSRIITDLEPDS